VESAINEPHVNEDDATEAEDFFGSSEPEEAPQDPGDFEPDTEPDTEPVEAPVEGGPTPEAVAAMDALSAMRQNEEPAGEPEPETKKKQPGSTAREYIVFQRLALTQALLKRMLKAMDEGEMPEPPIALVELGRRVCRTDREAIAEIYVKHASDLPKPPLKLAAVTTRGLNEREIKPREPRPVASDYTVD
jgi:hypothetical protein